MVKVYTKHLFKMQKQIMNFIIDVILFEISRWVEKCKKKKSLIINRSTQILPLQIAIRTKIEIEFHKYNNLRMNESIQAHFILIIQYSISKYQAIQF